MVGDRWRIIQGDALEVLRGLDPASVDALIADPPYCAGAISESQRTSADRPRARARCWTRRESRNEGEADTVFG